MFRTLYEASLVVFLAQGVLLPLILAAAGWAWFRQLARLGAIERELGEDGKRHERTLKSLLEALPKLRPVNCPACGSAVALEDESATCISCKSDVPLPEDYTATNALRRRLKRLSARAARHWIVARILTSTPARFFFFLMIFAEPLLFMVVLVGAATWGDTFFDRAFEAIGEPWGTVVMAMGFGGFIIWMILFVMLTNLSKELRQQLKDVPVLAPERVASEPAEFGNCQACGGGVHFQPRAFAILCGWCGVENIRPDHIRRERAGTEAKKRDTRASLFSAMEVIEGFISTVFIAMTILATAFLLLFLIAAMGDD